MSDKLHWEKIYTTKAPNQMSWYQAQPEVSLDLIRQSGLEKTAQIIDVGSGTSTLVDFLLEDGFQNITVLDISPTALDHAKVRLGAGASGVTWLEDDITHSTLPPLRYDLWHDRAVFHFLTDAEDRVRYVNAMKGSLKPGGHLIVASFAADGPAQCSGLNVMRYSPYSLTHEFGSDFDFIEGRSETHLTPFDTQQKFIYCYCRKR